MSLKEAVEIVERKLVTRALKKHKNNKTLAAKELELSRTGLYFIIKRLNLEELS